MTVANNWRCQTPGPLPMAIYWLCDKGRLQDIEEWRSRLALVSTVEGILFFGQPSRDARSHGAPARFEARAWRIFATAEAR